MEFRINGQPVDSIDITTDEGVITMKYGLGLAITTGGATAAPRSILVVAVGQSNMVGRSPNTAGPYFPAGGMQWKQGASAFTEVPTTWDPGVSGSRLDHLLSGAGTVSPDEFGIGRHFAISWMAANPADTLYFVPRALGGSAIASWAPGGGGSLYNTAVSAANSAAAAIPDGPDKVVFIWHQGESGAVSGYQGALNGVVDGFRADVTTASASSPFICGGFPSESYADVDVRTATQGLPTRKTYTGWADPSTPTEARMIDTAHFDEASMKVFGAKYYAAYVDSLLNTSGPNPATNPITVGAASFASLTGSGGTFTASGMAIGTAAANRVIVAAVAAQPREQDSMTIGGVPATRVGLPFENTTTNGTWIYMAKVPLGTSADVVMTLKSGEADFANMGVTLLPVYNARATVQGSGGYVTASSQSIGAGINGFAGDVIIGIAHSNAGGALLESVACASVELGTVATNSGAGFSGVNRYLGIGYSVQGADFSKGLTMEWDYTPSRQSVIALVMRPL